MTDPISMTNKHGEGVYKWKSGSYYKGSFYNDQRHGYGEMFWIDGSSYKGQWEQGAQKGEGKMTYAESVPYHKQPEPSAMEKGLNSEASYTSGRQYIDPDTDKSNNKALSYQFSL